MYKIEVRDDSGLWHDVRSTSGAVMTFTSMDEAHANLAKLYPKLVAVETYGGPKRTRVISILDDEDEDDQWRSH